MDEKHGLAGTRFEHTDPVRPDVDDMFSHGRILLRAGLGSSVVIVPAGPQGVNAGAPDTDALGQLGAERPAPRGLVWLQALGSAACKAHAPGGRSPCDDCRQALGAGLGGRARLIPRT